MNEISIDDIKMMIGELVIENKLLQKQLAAIRQELEQIKKSIQADNPE